MKVTFGDLPRYGYFSLDDPHIIYRKIDDCTAWIFRAYYCSVAVYEPLIGTPDDYPFSADQVVQVQEEPRRNRYYPRRAA